MRTYFAVLLLSAVASFVLTPCLRRLAFRMGVIDQPSSRKIHRRPIPRLGGVAVFGGFCIPWFGLYLIDNRVTAAFQEHERLFAALILSATAMLMLGIFDDFRGANARTKLTVQTLVAAGLYWGGLEITMLSNPFGEPMSLGWMSAPVTVLWMVAVTNAMNLLDGIDGLASGVTVCIALSLAMINIIQGSLFIALLTLSLAGACLGFLPYNFAPARIFLGDSGSLFLGMTLAGIGTLSLFKGTTLTLLLAPLILFGLPFYDTVSVVLGRVRRRAPLFQADRSHVHHRLLELGLNQKQVAYFLYAVTASLAALAVCLNLRQTPGRFLALAALLVVLAGLACLVWRFRIQKKGRAPNQIEAGS